MGHGQTDRREGQRPVLGDPAAPFSGPSQEVLADWAHRRIDISETFYLHTAPEAVKAIHDRYYSTSPATLDELRWRLQLIAEEEIGVKIRNARASEDAAASQIVRSVSGAG